MNKAAEGSVVLFSFAT